MSVNGAGNCPGLNFGHYAVLYYIQGLCGAAMVAFGLKVSKSLLEHGSAILKVLGGGTIVLLLFQPPFLMAAKVAYRFLFHPTHPAPYFSVTGAAAATLLIVAAMYPAIKWINRRAPWLNGIVALRKKA